MVFVVFLLDIGAVRQCGICCFSVRYWSGSDSVVFDGFHDRYWSCSDSAVLVVFLLDIGAVPTVWYLLLFC